MKNIEISQTIESEGTQKEINKIPISLEEWELDEKRFEEHNCNTTLIDNKTFVYIDPPYRPISDTSGFTSYNSDVFDDNEQIRLAKFIDEINAAGAKIVLSNSDPKNINPKDNFFDDLYKSYKIHRVSATRMINSNAEKRGKINELLISN